MTPYAKPMECGNHEDVRWAALSGKGLPTLMAQADGGPLQVSALPYTDEAMTPIEYTIDLPPSTNTVLTLASRTLGVGSNGCGPRPLDQYIVWSQPAEFSYVLRLLPSAQKDLPAIGRLAAPQNRVKPVAEKPKPRAHGNWTIVAANSFEPGEGDPIHAIDGNPDTFWHSRWSGEPAQPPHHLIIDFGQPLNVAAIIYTARKDMENGHVRDYEIYLSDNPSDWGTPAAKGRIRRNAEEETIRLSQPVKARYLKFVALSEQSGQPYATVAELEVEEAK